MPLLSQLLLDLFVGLVGALLQSHCHLSCYLLEPSAWKPARNTSHYFHQLMSVIPGAIRTEWQIVDHPHPRNSGNRKFEHGLSSYFDERICSMSGGISTRDSENHTTRLVLEMLEEFLWTIKYVEQKNGQTQFPVHGQMPLSTYYYLRLE
jgi:hypothetical protein